MSVRNLDALFAPQSIAVIGASRKANTVGKVLARNLFHTGFDGPILPVHPKHQSIEGVLTYGSVSELPFAPDLAVIATPPDTVADIVAELGANGTRAAVVITAGFGEGGDETGQARRQAVLDAARPYTLRVVGPNCIGVLRPDRGLNASFAHLSPMTGDLAFVAQSGAMATAVLDWATPRDIGFSHITALGNMIDVDFGDVLDYLGSDPNTRAILLYVESITEARKFMSAARATARTKPIIVIKAGRYAAGAKAASSHTGALAGSDAVYEAAFRRAGMLRVGDMDELFDAAETLSNAPRVRGDRMAILTNGGGLGVLATDAVAGSGGHLAELSDDTIAALNEVLPPVWSHGNPVDIIGDAPGSRYATALETLMVDANTDAVLVLNTPVAVADPTDAARATADTVGDNPRKPVFTSWLGEGAARTARKIFAEHRIPSYTTPENAVRGFMHLVNYRRSQDELMETPASTPHDFEPDTERAKQLIDSALEAGLTWMSEGDSKRALQAYGIPIVDTRLARDAEEAATSANELGFPVALKIQSPDITHKSEVGGVELELDSEQAVRDAAERMLGRVAKRRPDATVDGMTVQRMARRADAHELILGATTDNIFGPVILFGQGGTAVEVLRDQSLALPPLNMPLARRTIADTRVSRLLAGYRGQPAADVDAVALALIELSQLVADRPEIAEVDINPLLAGPDGVVALDARIKVQQPPQTETPRLAIRPYPRELEQTVTAPDGSEIFLRPIRPEDEPALQDFFHKLSGEDVRMRYFTQMRELRHHFAARLTQIDYDRAMAFVALPGRNAPGRNAPGRNTEEIWGVVRIDCDPDNRVGEYAVEVRSDIKGRGLGRMLMDRIIAYARERGTGEIVGDVLTENRRMLQICEDLGFEKHRTPDDPQITRVRLPLNKA
ncbi:acetyltransferase [Limimonas halophila]|uniref:Acetyltransferase n=1 Tax=Limimonas halophila TaxID=1082479 RepID=A0A1G7MFA6_9PROT|nr:bifunctional acetate--CoA ligase family protein/GNAT family N-acetyltransferase [Limimonas halophila]SDF60508.1 acetyltransferase [Limimonas halophila]